MLSSLLPHIAGNAFCFVSTILIAYQALRNPNRLRLFILVCSVITLPAPIINTLQLENFVSARCNSLVYLLSSLLMTVSHFYMMLDTGYRLRVGEGNWKHPLVIIGLFFLTCTSSLLLTEIVVLARNADGLQEYPLKNCFIAGVCCAIVCSSAVFTYTFKPLLFWRKSRTNEGLSRTTALGIWFFLIQNIWYTLYGVLYIWFFIANTWTHLHTLLALDYVFRFIENLIFTWPAPKFAIDFLSSKLPTSTSIGLSTSRKIGYSNSQQVMSSERYNKEERIEYNSGGSGNNQLNTIAKNSSSAALEDDQRLTRTANGAYDSRVTIVTRS